LNNIYAGYLVNNKKLFFLQVLSRCKDVWRKVAQKRLNLIKLGAKTSNLKNKDKGFGGLIETFFKIY